MLSNKSFVYFYSEHTNIKTLASLSQEYQIDWLSDKIEGYLLSVKITDMDLILEYLQISKKMEFKVEVENNLINQMSDPFPRMQSSPLFISLGRRIQIKIARRCLDKLMAGNGVSVDLRKSLLYKEDTGLLYFLQRWLSSPK